MAKTYAQVAADIATQLANNTTGSITAANIQNVSTDLLNYSDGQAPTDLTRAQISTSTNLNASFRTIDGAPWVQGTSGGFMATQDANGGWWNISAAAGYISMLWTSADKTGVTDCVAIAQAALNALHSPLATGVLDFTGGRWLMDSALLLVPEGCGLIGPWENLGEKSNMDYSNVQSVILLNPTYGIRYTGRGASTRGLGIFKKGLTAPTTLRQGLDLVNSFAGTAIQFGDGVTLNMASDGYVGYCMFLGFAEGVNCTQNERPHIEYINGDCLTLVHQNFVTDMNHLGDCHAWPFLTARLAGASLTQYTVSNCTNNGGGLIRVTTSAPTVLATGDRVIINSVTGTTEANGAWIITLINATTFDLNASTFSNAYISGGNVNVTAWYRSGKGYWFENAVGWGQAHDCFSYFHSEGYRIDSCGDTTFVNCGADAYVTVLDQTTIGWNITGNSPAPTLIGCKGAAHGTNIKIDNTSPTENAVLLVGFRSWGATKWLAQFNNGYAKCVNCDFIDGGVIRVEATCAGYSLIGGYANAISFSNAGGAPTGNFIDVVGQASQLNGALTAINAIGAFRASNGSGSGATSIWLRQEGAPTDQKTIEIISSASQNFIMRTMDDAYTNASNFITATRGSGYHIATVNLLTQETQRLQCDTNGNVIIGTAAIGTTATNGFFYADSCAGTPTGVPTTVTGRVPIILDTSGVKFWAYIGGAWKGVALT